jgi:hypothetical protein
MIYDLTAKTEDYSLLALETFLYGRVYSETLVNILDDANHHVLRNFVVYTCAAFLGNET